VRVPLALALFGWLMIAIFTGFLAAILALGLYSPRSGADVLDWRPTRSAELEAQNEADDVDQMLAAANALRRRRGAAEHSADAVAARLEADRRELDRRAREHREGG
jgi:hypothetical protein